MLVEGRRRGESGVWPSVIKFTRRRGVPLQRTGHAHPRNSSKRGISLLRNTHKSTSLLKGSEIGKARCSVTSISSFLAPLFLFRPTADPLSLAGIRPCLSSLSMSGHVCMPRVFLSGQLLREKHSRAPTILSDPDHLLDVSNARDANVSCGIRGRRKADGPEKRSALLLPDAPRSSSRREHSPRRTPIF